MILFLEYERHGEWEVDAFGCPQGQRDVGSGEIGGKWCDLHGRRLGLPVRCLDAQQSRRGVIYEIVDESVAFPAHAYAGIYGCYQGIWCLVESRRGDYHVRLGVEVAAVSPIEICRRVKQQHVLRHDDGTLRL